MDSDVSADGDFDNESPRIPSGMSNTSDEQQSPSPIESPSPEPKITSPSDRDSSPDKNDDSGVWPNSPLKKESPISPCSPFEEGDSQHFTIEEKLSPVHCESAYENVNGNLSPKDSVCSNQSNIASSLDSVSPSQFEHLETNKTDDDEIIKDHEPNLENKKGIIHFPDDLSDVSDIESNDSFGAEEENKEEVVVYISVFNFKYNLSIRKYCT